MAQSGHARCVRQCPLSGVKQTLIGRALMSAYDPKQTWAALGCCCLVAYRWTDIGGGATAAPRHGASGRCPTVVLPNEIFDLNQFQSFKNTGKYVRSRGCSSAGFIRDRIGAGRRFGYAGSRAALGGMTAEAKKGACNVLCSGIAPCRVVVSVSAVSLSPGARLPVGGLAPHKPTRKHATPWT